MWLVAALSFIGLAGGYLYIRHKPQVLVRNTSYDLDQLIDGDYEFVR